MKYLIILFVISLSLQLKSEVKLDIKNSRSSDSLFYQEVINDTLIISNNSVEVISVIGIGLSCGCTVVSESEFDITPKSMKRIPFTVDLEHTSEGKTINISIMTSVKDTIQLYYNYTVKEVLKVDPHFISITTPNNSVQYEFKIINNSDEEIKILNTNAINTIGNELKLEIPSKEIEPGEVINAKVLINDLERNNVGKLNLEYIVNNRIVLHKSIDYIINKGN